MLLDVLLAQGIRTLIDVRQMPLSRKAGFSKTSLGLGLEGVGIEYVHLRELGAPKLVRENLKATKDWAAYVEGFHAHLAHQHEALENVTQLLQKNYVALLCFEADYRECHRSLISARLEQMGKIESTVHLWIKTDLPVEGSQKASHALDIQNHPQLAAFVCIGD